MEITGHGHMDITGQDMIEHEIIGYDILGHDLTKYRHF